MNVFNIITIFLIYKKKYFGKKCYLRKIRKYVKQIIFESGIEINVIIYEISQQRIKMISIL